jgi:hypothetical protein
MPANEIATVAELIKVFGGPKATADLLGTTPQNVVNWKAAGKIPARLHKLHRGKLAATRLSISDGLWNFVEAAE